VNTFENQFARCFVKDLAGNCVKVKSRLEPTHRTELKRHKIEEKRPISFSRQADEFAFRLRRRGVVDVLKICGFPAQTWAVVDNLAIDLAGCVVDESHSSKRG